MTVAPWEWVLAGTAAVLIGIAKTGFGGLGMLSVLMFAQIMPAKQATGIVLPLLCFGDIIAAIYFRQHAKWVHLWRLFPWTAAGVVVGYFTLGRITDQQARQMIGGIVVALVALHAIRRRRATGHEGEHGWWFPATIGVLAGFTTLIANAAGPLMAIYLLAMRLPKMDYVGTGAIFFLLMNLFKVPFMVNLGLITWPSFQLNLMLALPVVAGTMVGRRILTRIDQLMFENIVLCVSAAAGLKLLF
ncbi:MAG: sulfite exporter TauE/SafE family protein [Opitutus sp.]|nr:sulfite exporter TauE/SafE family protein [Opitutus sp.]